MKKEHYKRMKKDALAGLAWKKRTGKITPEPRASKYISKFDITIGTLCKCTFLSSHQYIRLIPFNEISYVSSFRCIFYHGKWYNTIRIQPKCTWSTLPGKFYQMGTHCKKISKLEGRNSWLIWILHKLLLCHYEILNYYYNIFWNRSLE